MDKNYLHLNPIIYEDHLTPKGVLPREKALEASAAFHLARLAHRALKQVPEQVAYEGDKDQTVYLRRIADSTAVLYGIEDLNTMMAFMDFVKAEVLRLGWDWDSRFDAWLVSGGRSYNEVTREEGKLNVED